MCCLKIGGEFDTHLIASEMESKVSGIATFSGEGFSSVHPLSPVAQAAARATEAMSNYSEYLPCSRQDFHFLVVADDGWHFL
jgi:hypothetical protein